MCKQVFLLSLFGLNSPRQARILQKRFSTLPPRMSWHQVPLTPGARKVRTRCCCPTPQEREQELHSDHFIQEQFLWAHSGPGHTPPSEPQTHSYYTQNYTRLTPHNKHVFMQHSMGIFCMHFTFHLHCIRNV